MDHAGEGEIHGRSHRAGVVVECRDAEYGSAIRGGNRFGQRSILYMELLFRFVNIVHRAESRDDLGDGLAYLAMFAECIEVQYLPPDYSGRDTADYLHLRAQPFDALEATIAQPHEIEH